MLKNIFLAAALLATSAVWADDAPTASNDKAADITPTNPKFAQMQKRLLARIDRSIANLEDVRDCVASATDMASLKACKPEQGDKGKANADTDRDSK